MEIQDNNEESLREIFARKFSIPMSLLSPEIVWKLGRELRIRQWLDFALVFIGASIVYYVEYLILSSSLPVSGKTVLTILLLVPGIPMSIFTVSRLKACMSPISTILGVK